MPIEDALLLNPWGEGLITEVHPVYHAKLHRDLIGQSFRCEFWWMRHTFTISTFLLLMHDGHWRVHQSVADFHLCLKAAYGQRPGTRNKVETLLTFILTFLLQGKRYYIHLASILLQEQGRTVEVTNRRHSSYLMYSKVQNVVSLIGSGITACM